MSFHPLSSLLGVNVCRKLVEWMRKQQTEGERWTRRSKIKHTVEKLTRYMYIYTSRSRRKRKKREVKFFTDNQQKKIKDLGVHLCVKKASVWLRLAREVYFSFLESFCSYFFFVFFLSQCLRGKFFTDFLTPQTTDFCSISVKHLSICCATLIHWEKLTKS